MDVRAWYSTSDEDLETVSCFLDFNKIRESPKNMQNLMMERLLSMHDSQSESFKALSWSVKVEGKNRPWEEDNLIYLGTL